MITISAARAGQIVEDVLGAYGRWGIGPEVGGEWGMLRKLAREEYHEALGSGNRELLKSILFSPTGRLEWSGLFSSGEELGRMMEHDKSVRAELFGLTGELDNQPDAARHDVEALRLAGMGVKHIIEIGGGYGGLALRLCRHVAGLRYIDVDLADTLFLAYGFLAPLLPEGAVALGFDRGAQIGLMPEHESTDIELPWRPDVVVNYHGFGEMDKPTIARYFTLIGRWRPRWLIHENAARRDTLGPGDSAHEWPEVLISEYPPLPGYMIRESEVAPWAGGAGRYVRQVLEALW